MKKTIIYILVQLFLPALLFAQGSIFGAVSNSDLSVPANGELQFVGYLDNSDEEIRIETSTGAGYDEGNWYDDFQNYLTEAPGNPYDYHFFNNVNNQSAILSALIPNNSFEQKNIQLSAFSFPSEPAYINGESLADSTVRLSWDYNPAFTYRIFRRPTVSDGSFYRIDDPTGSLANFGINDSVFIDSTVDNLSEYDYLIIPIDNGLIGLHSEFVTVNSIPPSGFLCGDIDASGLINILDITYLLGYLYMDGPEPVPYASADVNNNGMLNILDVTYLIAYLYMGGPEPVCPDSI